MKTFFKPLKPASFFLFLSLMAGILAGNFTSDHKLFFPPVIFFLVVLVFPALYFNKKNALLIILGLIFSFGYFSIQIKLFPDLPSHHISHFLNSEKTFITGRVASFTKHYRRKGRITLFCLTMETKDHREKKITGKINLNIYGLSRNGLKSGDIIRFRASVKPVRNFMNPGAFDYERFLKLKEIFGTAYTDIKKIKILTRTGQMDFFTQLVRKIEEKRTKSYYFILDHAQRPTAGKITASLITGKKEVIPPDIRELFSKAGISHLLAISGLHLSIVSALFFYLFYWVLSFIPVLLIKGKSKKIAGLLTLFPLTWYAVFTGFSPSTQRAYLMIMVLLLSFVSEREKDILSSLSVAGILILMTDSTALFSISFQLSFMAVIFIVCGVFLLKKYSFIFKKNLFSKTGLMICITFFATLGTFPLTAHYFNMVSTIGIVSNLIFIPIIGFVVLPLGLISMTCISYFPSLAILIIHICNRLILFSITSCEFLVSIPWSWSRTLTLQWIEIAAIYLILFSVFLALKGQKKIAVSIFVLSFMTAIFNFSNERAKKIPDSNLAITIIDVGQGNSALIQTPEGKNILVDGGGFSDNTLFDTGRFIIAPFLWQKGIGALNYVILTHPESDHLNGLIFILQNFKVGMFIKNTDEKKSVNYQRLIKTCHKKNIKIWEPSIQGEQLCLGKTVLVFFESENSAFSNDFNNNSLVFKVIYKKFSMLFPGDILKDREKSLSANNTIDLQSDIMLSPHHGSSTSSSEIFLDKLQPESVIISCGWHNRYGFPHYKVLKRYGKKAIRIFRTDENGAVFISSNGKDHDILTYKGG